jgi:Ca2+-binding RTX toxin-like protein
MSILGAEDLDSLTSVSGDGVDTANYSSGNGPIVTLSDGGLGGSVAGGTDIVDYGSHGTPVTLSDGTEAGAVLVGGGGSDSLAGGDGVDTGYYGGTGSPVTLQGGAGAGDPGGVLVGEGGGNGLGGGDTLFGGNGPSVGGSAAADTLDGGADTFTSSLSNATINLAKGYASSTGGSVELLHGIENVVASGHHVHVIGTADANIIDASHASGDNVLDGGAGDDTLIGGTADGTVNRFFGGAGGDTFEGGSNDDAGGPIVYNYLYYDSSPAAVHIDLRDVFQNGGDAEGDAIEFQGNNAITGVIGSAFDDVIHGRDQDRTISFDTKVDSILYGGDGNDTLIFGSGRDWMSGGTGADTFAYDAAGGHVGDAIRDFSSAQGDKIDLSAIDADGDASNGRTAFHFVGQTVDPGHGGVGFALATGGIEVTINAAETMTVYLAGVTAVTANDFHL